MAAKFQIFKGINSNYYFRLKMINNGEIILSSEGYTTNQSCRKGIESVKKHSPYDSNYTRYNSPSYYFVLKSNNHETIGKSETYSSAQMRDNGIESVKRNAPNADIEDLS